MIKINTEALAQIITDELKAEQVHNMSAVISLGTIDGKQVQLCVTDDLSEFYEDPEEPIIFSACDECESLKAQIAELSKPKKVSSNVALGDTVKPKGSNLRYGIVTSLMFDDEGFLVARVQPKAGSAYLLAAESLEAIK